MVAVARIQDSTDLRCRARRHTVHRRLSADRQAEVEGMAARRLASMRDVEAAIDAAAQRQR